MSVYIEKDPFAIEATDSPLVRGLKQRGIAIRKAFAAREYDLPDGPTAWLANRIIKTYSGDFGTTIKQGLSDPVAIALVASTDLHAQIEANKGSQVPNTIEMWSTMQAGASAFFDPIIQPDLSHELSSALIQDPTGIKYANDVLAHIRDRKNGICPPQLNPAHFYKGMQLAAEVFSILSR